MKISSWSGLARIGHAATQKEKMEKARPSQNGRRGRPGPALEGGGAGQARPKREGEGQARPKSKGRARQGPDPRGEDGKACNYNYNYNYFSELELCGTSEFGI